MKKIFIFTVTLGLASCAGLPKPNYPVPPGVQTSEYKGLYESCIKQQAERLDDGISPANIIGQSIANACTNEYIAYSMQRVSEDNQAVKNAFYSQLTYDRDLAAAAPAHYVLSRRDYLRTHKDP